MHYKCMKCICYIPICARHLLASIFIDQILRYYLQKEKEFCIERSVNVALICLNKNLGPDRNLFSACVFNVNVGKILTKSITNHKIFRI